MDLTRLNELKDPKGRLQGNGKYVRHVKIFTSKDIDETYFAKLIKQAVRYERS